VEAGKEDVGLGALGDMNDVAAAGELIEEAHGVLAVVEVGDEGALDVDVDAVAELLGFVARGVTVDRGAGGFGESARFAEGAVGGGCRACTGGVGGAEGAENVGVVGMVEASVEGLGSDFVALRGRTVGGE